jgi:hypothetical protein
MEAEQGEHDRTMDVANAIQTDNHFQQGQQNQQAMQDNQLQAQKEQAASTAKASTPPSE